MSNEGRFQASLQVNNSVTGLIYLSQPTSFIFSITGSIGPTPGAIAVSPHGTGASLAQLTTPGPAWFQNLDTVYNVEWGVYDLIGNVFWPVGLLLPGMPQQLYLSPNIGKDEPGTGTGAAVGSTQLWFKSLNPAGSVVRVDCFQA